MEVKNDNRTKCRRITKKSKNRYELVVAISKRGRQIVNGKEAKVKIEEKSPITISALKFSKDKYCINRKDEDK